MAYTGNFIRAQTTVEEEYGDQVEVLVRNNVPEPEGEAALRELAAAGCDLIFANSYGYGEAAKKVAGEYPNIQICQATCENANEEPFYSNYHTFMGEIYQGRYVSGIVAGMKLQELIEEGVITKEEAKVGYVGAYPQAQVISGYTAFFLGIRSVVPTAVMTVKYTGNWSSYTLEKKCAEELIEEGCVIISQHSGTIGSAAACEACYPEHKAYHIGYSQSMLDIAPATSLISTRINWTPYITAAVEAVLSGESIEKHEKGHIHGNDVGAGFEQDWVQMMELNSLVAADGSKEAIERTIQQFKAGEIQVFQGDYLGVNPEDENDTYDLNQGYPENKSCSAPTFSYVLKDVITIEND